MSIQDRLHRAKKRLRGSRGFTLIELLIVLAIVSLLLTLAMPQYFHSIDVSKEKVLAENLLVTRDAIDKFYGDVGRYPDSLDELVDKHYLRALPFDPITDSATTWVIVPPDEQFPGKVYDLKSGAEGATLDGVAYGTL
jgi:general secretion pathway protein G